MRSALDAVGRHPRRPFDRPAPRGIRKVYPLTTLQTLDVMRRDVPYGLPPMRPDPPRRRPVGEPPDPPDES